MIAIDTLHLVDHAPTGVLNPALAPPSADSTANALIHDNQVARRRSYKEDLVETTRTWPGPPSEALVKSLIKLGDKHDDRRIFVNIEPEKLYNDLEHYEIYAWIGNY